MRVKQVVEPRYLKACEGKIRDKKVIAMYSALIAQLSNKVVYHNGIHSFEGQEYTLDMDIDDSTYFEFSRNKTYVDFSFDVKPTLRLQARLGVIIVQTLAMKLMIEYPDKQFDVFSLIDPNANVVVFSFYCNRNDPVMTEDFGGYNPFYMLRIIDE